MTKYREILRLQAWGLIKLALPVVVDAPERRFVMY